MNSGLNPTFRRPIASVDRNNFRFNNALNLDGTNDLASIPVGTSGATIPTMPSNGSFGCWAKFTKTSNNAFFTWGSSTSNRIALFSNLSSLLFIQLNSTNTALLPAVILRTDFWNHYLLNWQNLGSYYQYDLYRDTILVATTTATTFPVSAVSSVFRLGTLNPVGVERPFGGLIDEVVVYDRPLNTTEIRQLYNKGYGNEYVPLKGLLARWRFDETTGTTASDSSGNGRDLTLVNGPTFVSHF